VARGCFGLQGWFGARVAALACASGPFRFLGGVLFVLAPPLTQRTGHATLCAHAALLAALALALRRHRDRAAAIRTARGVTAIAWILAPANAFIAVECLALGLAVLVQLRLEGAFGGREALARAGGLVVGQVAIWAAFGYLTAAPTHAQGFGEFSADLLAFGNSFGASRFLPSLPARPGQWEGNAYLGLGGLALCAAALALAVRRRAAPAWRVRAPLFIACAGMAVLALSSVVTAGGLTVLDLRALYRPVGGLVGPFRASGRLVWPLYYLAMAGAVLAVGRAWAGRPGRAALVLGIAVAVQLADVSPALGTRFPERPWRLRDPRWSLAAGEYRELLMVPPQIVGIWSTCRGLAWEDDDRWVPFAFAAYRAGLDFNGGYLTRGAGERYGVACSALLREVEEGRLRARSVYVVHPGWADRLARAGAVCGALDGARVCVAPGAPARLRQALSRAAP
jgi:hypothetical protein